MSREGVQVINYLLSLLVKHPQVLSSLSLSTLSSKETIPITSSPTPSTNPFHSRIAIKPCLSPPEPSVSTNDCLPRKLPIGYKSAAFTGPPTYDALVFPQGHEGDCSFASRSTRDDATAFTAHAVRASP